MTHEERKIKILNRLLEMEEIQRDGEIKSFLDYELWITEQQKLNRRKPEIDENLNQEIYKFLLSHKSKLYTARDLIENIEALKECTSQKVTARLRDLAVKRMIYNKKGAGRKSYYFIPAEGEE